MRAKRWLFNGAVLLWVLVLPGLLRAQEPSAGGSPAVPVSTLRNRRCHRGYEGWKRLIPTHVKLQFAGGIGLLSGGAGWDYGRKCRWETDVLVGVVPRHDARSAHATFTVKQNYIPWSIACGGRIAVEPLTCAAYLSVVTGQEFWTRVPERYPSRSYYPMPTKLRAYLSVGQRFVWHFAPERRLRSLTAYYELCTCDYYLVSKLSNRTLDLTDIFSLAVGMKLQLF